MGKLVNRARMTIASATSTVITLGAAVPGYGTLAAEGVNNGDAVSYVIEDGSGWEFGQGVYAASGTTVTRLSVQGSSSGGAALAGLSSAAQIYVTALASDFASTAGGLINKLRNGTMDVFQRGTSASIPVGGAYFADGWIVVPAGAAVTAQQAPGRKYTVNGLTVTGASGNTDVTIKQRVESYIGGPLSGQVCTFQAWIYNSTGASITPTLSVKHPTSAQDTFSSLTTDVSAASLQPCPSGAWAQVAYTFQAATTLYGMEIGIDFGALANSSASVSITECDLRATPNLPIGQCSAPAAPELRPVSNEMALCQRYYYTSGIVTIIGYQSAGYPLYLTGTYPVSMRAAPSVALTATGSSGMSGLTLLVSQPNAWQVQGTNTGTGVGYINFTMASSAEL